MSGQPTQTLSLFHIKSLGSNVFTFNTSCLKFSQLNRVSDILSLNLWNYNLWTVALLLSHNFSLQIMFSNYVSAYFKNIVKKFLSNTFKKPRIPRLNNILWNIEVHDLKHKYSRLETAWQFQLFLNCWL